MIHLDLFSGIGGFAIAVDEVWDDVEHIFCDNDEYCQQLLKLRYPESKIYGDIRTITNTEGWESRKQTKQERREDTSRGNIKVDILTGGFPCQPFSQAGKRGGTSDNRYLWPEMLRVIQLTKPRWVVAENVRGLLTLKSGVVFEQVCTDLEGEGYTVQAFIIPAVSKDAPHRRDRIWFVANCKSSRCGTGVNTSERDKKGGEYIQENRQQGERQGLRISETNSNTTDSTEQRRQGSSSKDERRPRQPSGDGSNKGWDWEENWIEVATELCGVDDGTSAKLDGFELSKAQHRVQRLKALGNAIVPQVATEIMRAIKRTLL